MSTSRPAFRRTATLLGGCCAAALLLVVFQPSGLNRTVPRLDATIAETGATGYQAAGRPTSAALESPHTNKAMPGPVADVASSNALAMQKPTRGIADMMAERPMISMAMPAPGLAPPGIGSMQPETTSRFEGAEPGAWTSVASAPIATFALESDTASWAYMRGQIAMGSLPDPRSVRIEEMLNRFAYADPEPAAGEAFGVSTTVIATPWDEGTRLVRVGVRTAGIDPENRPRRNLTFLIDVSGSMGAPDKLPLLKAGLAMMVRSLDPDNRVAIVTYAGHAGVALEPTKAADRARILSVIEGLGAGGGTAGAQGLTTAYALAAEMTEEGAVNRVMIGTDGDFNVGVSDPDGLEAFIAKKRDTGIFLSVLGVGRQGYSDATAQRPAQNGNGVAAYLDTLEEARLVLVEGLDKGVIPVANDAKAQVEFNPAFVAEYRLLGYETRALAREDFDNDRVDAGEIGAGQSVTALFEITPTTTAARRTGPVRYASSDADTAREPRPDEEWGFVRLRYKIPGNETSRLFETPILAAEGDAVATREARFAAAVGATGMLLRGQTLGQFDLRDALALAQSALGDDIDGERRAFAKVVEQAAALRGE